MNFFFRKKTGLQRFLNVEHGAFMRYFVGSAAALIALIATAKCTLAAEVFHRFAILNDFKLGARRVSWYLRRSWVGLSVSRDQIFVFPHELTVPQLAALRDFLKGRGEKIEPLTFLLDLAYVSGMDAVLKVGKPEFSDAMARFADDADAALRLLTKDGPAAAPEPAVQSQDRFSIADAEQAIKDLTLAMPIREWPWFVLSGTFLGLIRENGFLAHDYDIDIGVIADEVDLVAFEKRLVADTRFFVHSTEYQTSIEKGADGRWHGIQRPVLMKVAHQNGTHIDVFIHYRDGAVIWHGSSLYRWDNSDFALVPYDFVGTRVLGPQDADRYLTENYHSWRVPLRAFHSAVDTTNQRVVANPLSVAIYLRRASLAGSANIAASAALLRVLELAGYLCRDEFGVYRFDRSAFCVGQP